VEYDGNGSWNDFSKWTAAGGVPGIDGALSVGDTATFQSVTPDSNPRTVSLNGNEPTLAGITFDSTAKSYTIAQGSAARSPSSRTQRSPTTMAATSSRPGESRQCQHGGGERGQRQQAEPSPAR